MIQAHPRYRELIKQSLAVVSSVGDLGTRPLDCGPGWVEVGPGIPPRHVQQSGFIHAGTQATLAGHAAGAIAVTLVEKGQTVLGLELKLNLLRPVLYQRLLCHAEVLRIGRQTTMVEAEMSTEQDGRRRLLSKATMAMAVVALTG